MSGAQSLWAPGRRVLGLGLVAGYVDALGFILLGGVYASAMTGNTTQLAISLVRSQWAVVTPVGTTIGAFFLGALLASLMRRRLRRSPVELLLMAALILLVQAVRMCVPDSGWLELPMLAAAMAMQGQTITRFGVTSLQTIVVTSNLLRFAEALAARLSGEPGPDLVLPGCTWFGYALGAGGGTLASIWLGLPFLVPACVLSVVAVDLLILPPRGPD